MQPNKPTKFRRPETTLGGMIILGERGAAASRRARRCGVFTQPRPIGDMRDHTRLLSHCDRWRFLQRVTPPVCLLGLIADNMRQRRLRNFTGEARDVPAQPKLFFRIIIMTLTQRAGITCGYEAGGSCNGKCSTLPRHGFSVPSVGGVRSCT